MTKRLTVLFLLVHGLHPRTSKSLGSDGQLCTNTVTSAREGCSVGDACFEYGSSNKRRRLRMDGYRSYGFVLKMDNSPRPGMLATAHSTHGGLSKRDAQQKLASSSNHHLGPLECLFSPILCECSERLGSP